MSERTISSRRIFWATAVTIVVVSAGFGLTVGATGQNRHKTLRLFGVSLFKMNPMSMALFGIGVTTTILIVLFALVRYASQFDTDRVA